MIEEVIKSLDYGPVGHFSWLLALWERAIKAELPLRLQRVGLNFRSTDNENGETMWEVRNSVLLVFARVRS